MRHVVLMAVVMITVSALAGPKPVYPYTTEAATAKSLSELIAENPDTFEPIINAAIGSGGAILKVDPVAVVDASKEKGGVLGHLKRNWGKYTVGTLGTAGLIWANNRDFWQDSGSAGDSTRTVTYNLSAGRDIVIGDGNTTGSGTGHDESEEE